MGRMGRGSEGEKVGEGRYSFDMMSEHGEALDGEMEGEEGNQEAANIPCHQQLSFRSQLTPAPIMFSKACESEFTRQQLRGKCGWTSGRSTTVAAP